MTFEAWLKKQIKRNDPVGNLANDFLLENKLEGDELGTCDRHNLDKWNACGCAYEALKQAKKEYSIEIQI